MGQSASSQRDRERFLSRDSRRFSQLVQNRAGGEGPPSGTRDSHHHDHLIIPPPAASSPPQDSPSSLPFAAFSRQISAQSIPVVRGGGANTRDVSTRDSIFYEQQEERPLVHMEDLGMRTHITASPMPRRSRMSRLSSIVLPGRATSDSAAITQQGSDERISPRPRLSNRRTSGTNREEHGARNHRLSIFGSLSSSASTVSRARRRRERAPISRPFPLNADAIMPPSGFPTSPLHETHPTRSLGQGLDEPSSGFFAAPFNGRLSRVRRSISSPLEALLPTTRSTAAQEEAIRLPPQRPERFTLTGDPEYLLPPVSVPDASIDLNDPTLDQSNHASSTQRQSFIPTVTESPERAITRTDGHSWTERWTERAPVARREGRRMPSMLRGRSSRLVRRDNDGPLPRILSLAASAIAAQLSGTPEPPIADMQAIAPDDLDGSLNQLFRTLQSATNLAGDGGTHGGGNGPARPAGTLPPLNFLRVFRFVSQNPGTTTPNEIAAAESLDRRSRSDSQPAVTENISDEGDGRTVTLVVVGVRSVPSEQVTNEDATASDPSLDSLLNLPPLAPSTNLLRSGAGGLLRHANGRSRFPHRRRASSGAVSTFPANYDSQRHQRALSSSSRQGSVDTSPVSGTATPFVSTPLVLSESPPGPHPPPSTPAEPGLSAQSSQAPTPSRRPSSASAIQQPPIPNRDIATQHFREAGIATSDQHVTRGVQQRRRSDSEFARHRDLGAGAARRNGVVEPDNVETTNVPASGSRSWLIYVVGTNLSEDHPALTTPSLFTDVSAQEKR